VATTEQIASLIAYVGGTTTRDDAFASATYDEAEALVTAYIDSRPCAASIKAKAILECGSKLWAWRGAPNGQVTYDPDGVPIQMSKDPMITAAVILDRVLAPGGFA